MYRNYAALLFLATNAQRGELIRKMTFGRYMAKEQISGGQYYAINFEENKNADASQFVFVDVDTKVGWSIKNYFVKNIISHYRRR